MSPPLSLPARHREALVRAVRVATTVRTSDDSTLTALLYSQWYTQLSSPKPVGWSAQTPFITRLRQALAHAARGRDGRLDVPALVDRQAMDIATGYWSASSSAPPAPSRAVRRVYWNVVQQGAPALVHDLVATLPAVTRWTLKVPVDAGDFQRPDTLVLYLAADEWPALLPLVHTLAVRHQRTLHPDVPPLTTWVAPGVASALDPGIPGESFGLTLCRRIAEVLSTRPTERDPSVLVAALECALFGSPRSTRRRRVQGATSRGHG